MCQRIGINWKCEHQWRGWITCQAVLTAGQVAPGQYHEKCPFKDDIRCKTPTPFYWARHQSIFLVDWCCTPQCCQTNLDYLRGRILQAELETVALRDSNDQNLRAYWKGTEGTRKTSYLNGIKRHLTKVCYEAHDNMGWKSNTMAEIMEDPVAGAFVAYIDGNRLTRYHNQNLAQLTQALQARGLVVQNSNIQPKAQYINVKVAMQIFRQAPIFREDIGQENDVPAWHFQGALQVQPLAPPMRSSSSSMLDIQHGSNIPAPPQPPISNTAPQGGYEQGYGAAGSPAISAGGIAPRSGRSSAASSRRNTPAPLDDPRQAQRDHERRQLIRNQLNNLSLRSQRLRDWREVREEGQALYNLIISQQADMDLLDDSINQWDQDQLAVRFSAAERITLNETFQQTFRLVNTRRYQLGNVLESMRRQ